jgi:aquaporin Z
MSMNPARTFGSGVVAGVWTAMWVYFLAPPLGMLAAAQLHLWLFGARPTLCAKMRHDPTMPCHFCAERAARAGARSPAPTLTGTISGTTHF